MNIGVLTSSRADYGIYRPLLKRLEEDPFFNLELIVFGTHLSQFHGFTVQNIRKDGFCIAHRVDSLTLGDSEEAVSSAMALTSAKFSGLWASVVKKYDLIFCLGDRYEMFAAVSAGVPFNLKFAHIHGGEETRGAIDNVFRHSITHMSAYHFTTTEQYKSRVLQLLGQGEGSGNSKVLNVGSLSLDNLNDMELLSVTDFSRLYGIDISKPTILFTFHPETVRTDSNEVFIDEIEQALEKLIHRYRIIITMPNADTRGNLVRDRLKAFGEKHENRVLLVESFGTRGYFSCMSHANFLMGNSSSGIIEAASFGKYVINLGDRQKGRATGENVLHVKINQDKILSAVRDIEMRPPFSGKNIYWNRGAAHKIIDQLKKDFK